MQEGYISVVCAGGDGEYFEECSDRLPEDDGDGGDEGPAHQTEEASQAVDRLPAVLSDGGQANLDLPPESRHLVPGGREGRGRSVENYWNNVRPVSQSEELCQVEDDGEEEEDEGVGQPGLGAEAELKAVDG